MALIVENFRAELIELKEKYPEIPLHIILKVDTTFHGLKGTKAAEEFALRQGHIFKKQRYGKGKQTYIVDGAILSDGTWLEKPIFPGDEFAVGLKRRLPEGNDPYVLDVVDGRYWLFFDGKPVEEVSFYPVSPIYSKTTKHGVPMDEVASAFPGGCLAINIYGYCYFWNIGKQCKYCSLLGGPQVGTKGVRDGISDEQLEDIEETVFEALKEKGRWQIFRLVAGSDPRGDTPYEHETEEYIKVLGALGNVFGSKDFNARLICSALSKEQWQQLKNAGAVAVEPHIEVIDKEKFAEICPGKNTYFGYDYWWQSAVDAVEVYGRGNVCSQIVGGAELAQPYGFGSVDEALGAAFEGAEKFARYGITTSSTALYIQSPSKFYQEKQSPPGIEYYIRLIKGLHEIRQRNKLPVSFNDYRRCGGHADTILSRLDYPEASFA